MFAALIFVGMFPVCIFAAGILIGVAFGPARLLIHYFRNGAGR